MFKGFLWKIWRLEVLLSIFIIALLLFSVAYYQLGQERERIIKRNYITAETITHIIESSYLRGIWPLKTLGMFSKSEDIAFLRVVKTEGKVFWADDPEIMSQIIEDPFLGLDKPRIRKDFFKGEEINIITYPLIIELGEKPWSLFLGVSFKPLTIVKKTIIFQSFVLFLLVIFLTIPISIYLARRTTKPLEILRRGAEIIGKGDLKHRIEIKTGDEIEELAESFNQMTADLQEFHAALEEEKKVLEVRVETRTKELKELTESLEARIKERTKELQEKINELERFQRLTVGRELKMVELKEEIKNLKKSGKNIKVENKQHDANMRI